MRRPIPRRQTVLSDHFSVGIQPGDRVVLCFFRGAVSGFICRISGNRRNIRAPSCKSIGVIFRFVLCRSLTGRHGAVFIRLGFNQTVVVVQPGNGIAVQRLIILRRIGRVPGNLHNVRRPSGEGIGVLGVRLPSDRVVRRPIPCLQTVLSDHFSAGIQPRNRICQRCGSLNSRVCIASVNIQLEYIISSVRLKIDAGRRICVKSVPDIQSFKIHHAAPVKIQAVQVGFGTDPDRLLRIPGVPDGQVCLVQRIFNILAQIDIEAPGFLLQR